MNMFSNLFMGRATEKLHDICPFVYFTEVFSFPGKIGLCVLRLLVFCRGREGGLLQYGIKAVLEWVVYSLTFVSSFSQMSNLIAFKTPRGG